jgi:ribulose kinase
MAAKFVAAIDHGTTSTRCILFDQRGSPIAIAQRGQAMHYPRPGWVELDMEEVWQRTQECIHEALRSAGATPADVAGIGITNERESVVFGIDGRDARSPVRSSGRTPGRPPPPTRLPPTEASTASKIAPACRSRRTPPP